MKKNSLSSGDPRILILESDFTFLFSRTFAKPHVFVMDYVFIYSLPTDSAEGGAEDDVYHELRVFALRQIQSRFAGNYKNLLVCRYHSPPDLSSNHSSRSRRKPHSHQVWPLTQFFLFPLCKKSLICLEVKSMTPYRGNTILFRSSQQLPRLRLGPSKGFLS